MKRKEISIRILSLLMAAAMVTGAAGCSSKDKSSSNTNSNIVIGDESTKETASSKSLPEVNFPSEPVVGKAADAGTSITLSGDSISVQGSGAKVEGSVVTITSAGTYLLTGTLEDGQIIVDTQEEKKVELILNGVKLNCSNSAPIFVINSPKKTVITLQEGSVNLVEDGKSYDVPEGDTETDYPSAAIYSKDDLKIDGSGALYVKGNYNKGIFSKDDLELESGQIYVVAVDDGIRGKDSVEVTSAVVNITAGGDGLRTSNDTDEGKGYILINGGELYIKAEQDGIQAVTDLTINDGTIVVESGGGSANSSTTSDKWGQWGGGHGGMVRPGGSTESSTTTEEGDSAKGIKATGSLTINGGSFTIDSSDDSVHSNDQVNITGGSFYISSGDDGIHADNSLNVSGGAMEITKSYEGLESLALTISGGIIRLTSSDDGLNAGGGSDGSSMGGRPGQNSFGSSSNAKINITGGYVVVNASGDGIDSNGSVDMTGGTVIVYGPSDNGNGALDYDRSFNISGGFLLAVGSSGMAQSATGEGQEVMAFTVNMAKDTLMDIKDSKGNSVVTFAAPKSYSCVVFSSPDLKSGEYTISSGGSYSSEAVDGIYTGGSYSGGSELGSLSL